MSKVLLIAIKLSDILLVTHWPVVAYPMVDSTHTLPIVLHSGEMHQTHNT